MSSLFGFGKVKLSVPIENNPDAKEWVSGFYKSDANKNIYIMLKSGFCTDS